MKRPSPLIVLQARARARATLFAACWITDVDEAIRPLLAYAERAGIAEEQAIDIIAAEFQGIAVHGSGAT